MLGCSNDAVKKKLLWIALCAYLLIFFAKVKAIYDSPYSITEICTIL